MSSARLPRKRFYRARAHSNPLSDSHFPVPICPSEVDYSSHYPHFFPKDVPPTPKPKVRFADVGCGFGGMLVSLSPSFPDTLMIGMELRDKAFFLLFFFFSLPLSSLTTLNISYHLQDVWLIILSFFFQLTASIYC